MDQYVFNRLLQIRNRIHIVESGEHIYELADISSMPNAVKGTPFRVFEPVPLERPSRRKVNTTLSFDPYVDTLFDYPIIIKKRLASEKDALQCFNHHLTLQVPHCGMNCWHCYNPKEVCDSGLEESLWHEVRTQRSTAREIFKHFTRYRNAVIADGKHCNVIRVSGGEPFLVPELIAELLQCIADENNPDLAPVDGNQSDDLGAWAKRNVHI